MSEKPTDTCGPCRSGLHERCYEPCLCRDRGHPVETLTPSEVALAKTLAAWVEWPAEDGSDPSEATATVGSELPAYGLVDSGGHSAEGRTLLDRARKAGVL